MKVCHNGYIMCPKITYFERCQQIRSFILLVFRYPETIPQLYVEEKNYGHGLVKEIGCGIPIIGCKERITYVYYPILNKKSEFLYLYKFKKNLLKLKKKCEDLFIQQYKCLPGALLPLDVRNHIISFISPYPIIAICGEELNCLDEMLRKYSDIKLK
tara:strand:- start:34563 stop:35033 length:471 start_codon:yes stop_codon:yes gene_type:complete